MRLRNSQHGYGAVTRILHWLVALLIITLIGLGWWMVDLSYYDRWYNEALEWHKALGMIALVLGAGKVLWYVTDTRVSFVEGLADHERLAALVVHRVFLLLMVLIPVSGYLISTSAGDGISLFGWMTVPALISKNDAIRDVAINVHYYAAYGAAGLVVLHAGAACKHHFIDRDATLRKMLW